jgi:membrane-associated phospholipid phosphatase
MNRFAQADSYSSPFNKFILVTIGFTFVLLTLLTLVIPKGNEVLWINSKYSMFQDWFFSFVTRLGEGFLFSAILISMLFIRFHYAATFSAIGLLNGLLVSFLKRGIFPDLKRPIVYFDDSLLHFVDGITVHSSYSFPSGHTAAAFATALALALFFKNRSLTIILFMVALLVGYSRIYLLQHFLVDVTAGAAIGLISAFIVFAIDPFKEKSWADQRLHVHFQIKGKDTIQPLGR